MSVHQLSMLLGAALLVGGGCSEAERTDRATPNAEGGSDDAAPQLLEIDEEEILAEGMDYASVLVRFTEGPEQSETHPDAASVQVWGVEDAMSKFQGINPNDPTQAVSFDEGTMLVKEHLDTDGATVGLTVMYKGPAGYNPEGRDWFWARVREDIVTDSGRVQWCLDCHSAAYNTDLVVGFAKSE